MLRADPTNQELKCPCTQATKQVLASLVGSGGKACISKQVSGNLMQVRDGCKASA